MSLPSCKRLALHLELDSCPFKLRYRSMGVRFAIEEPELACTGHYQTSSFKQALAIVTAGLRRLTLWRPSTARNLRSQNFGRDCLS